MNLNGFIFLGILFAAPLLASSTIVPVTSKGDSANEINRLDDEKRSCKCCGGYFRGKCNKYCCHPDESRDTKTQATLEKSHETNQKETDSGCKHGCCGGYFPTKCRKCCSYPGESDVKKTETVPESSSLKSDPAEEAKHGGFRGGHGGGGVGVGVGVGHGGGGN